MYIRIGHVGTHGGAQWPPYLSTEYRVYRGSGEPQGKMEVKTELT